MLINPNKNKILAFSLRAPKCLYLMLMRDESVYHVWGISIIWSCVAKKWVLNEGKGGLFIT
jgi:hypothetical protein